MKDMRQAMMTLITSRELIYFYNIKLDVTNSVFRDKHVNGGVILLNPGAI
jgi:hypothetical protein